MRARGACQSLVTMCTVQVWSSTGMTATAMLAALPTLLPPTLRAEERGDDMGWNAGLSTPRVRMGEAGGRGSVLVLGDVDAEAGSGDATGTGGVGAGAGACAGLAAAVDGATPPSAVPPVSRDVPDRKCRSAVRAMLRAADELNQLVRRTYSPGELEAALLNTGGTAGWALLVLVLSAGLRSLRGPHLCVVGCFTAMALASSSSASAALPK